MSWKNDGTKLTKEFKFKDFKDALAFVNNVGELAEQSNHHPDIKIHSYNKVLVELTSHHAATVTDKDTKMASELDRLYK
jgi:4a-hydroxytetrahydrobiopterin dehydratase